jgi:AraC-like DNA-binding protein
MSKFIRTENVIHSDIGANVVSAGYCMVDDNNYAIPLNNQHPYYKLILVPKGTLTLFDENNNQHVLKENYVALIKPNIKNSYTQEAVSEDYWVNFIGAKSLLSMLKLDGENIFITKLDSNTTKRLIPLFEDVINEAQLGKFAHEASTQLSLTKMLLLIARFINGNFGSPRQILDKIKPAIIDMNNNYQATRSMDYYAKICNMSKSSFMHNFSKYMGTTPVKYINSIKLKNAKSLLDDSSLNISEISDILGFSSSLYFSDLFQKEFGVRPSTYRQSKRH